MGHFIWIPAEVHSDDHAIEVEFDAVQWFRQAVFGEIDELVQCNWGGDYPADRIAIFMADRNDEVKKLFEYLELIRDSRAKKDCHGFECHITDIDAAVKYLRVYRTDIHNHLELSAEFKQG